MITRLNFLFIFFAFGLFFLARAGISNESADETDRQITFVDQTMHVVEQQRLRREAERQAEVNRQFALKKKQTEAQLAKQFAWLSGKLSGLPEIPSFKGKFQEKPFDGEEPVVNG